MTYYTRVLEHIFFRVLTKYKHIYTVDYTRRSYTAGGKKLPRTTRTIALNLIINVELMGLAARAASQVGDVAGPWAPAGRSELRSLVVGSTWPGQLLRSAR